MVKVDNCEELSLSLLPISWDGPFQPAAGPVTPPKLPRKPGPGWGDTVVDTINARGGCSCRVCCCCWRYCWSCSSGNCRGLWWYCRKRLLMCWRQEGVHRARSAGTLFFKRLHLSVPWSRLCTFCWGCESWLRLCTLIEAMNPGWGCDVIEKWGNCWGIDQSAADTHRLVPSLVCTVTSSSYSLLGDFFKLTSSSWLHCYSEKRK